MLAKRVSILAAALASALTWAGAGVAQVPDPTRDEALDRLLEKAEEARPSPRDKPSAGSRPSPTRPTGGAGAKVKAKESSEVSSKDQALDNLLEGLGQTEEKAAPDERPRGPGGAPDAPPDAKEAKPDTDALKGQSRELDQHLEDLTGRKRKKKGQDSQGSGPLSQVIKEMRDVEQRLEKDDTGQETRKRQEQIVKNLETLIDQVRESSAQGQPKRQLQLGMKPGKPGPKPGSTPGTTGGNAPQTRPSKPEPRKNIPSGKDVWGHLPAELRQELENGLGEESLPEKEELIRRYFLSISKKSLLREE